MSGFPGEGSVLFYVVFVLGDGSQNPEERRLCASGDLCSPSASAYSGPQERGEWWRGGGLSEDLGLWDDRNRF